jgi:hypothetical protein
MTDSPLDVGNHPPSIGLIPAPVKVLGHHPELDHKIAGQVLRLNLAALFPPEPKQRLLVITHDDSGVGSADEATAIREPSICGWVESPACDRRLSCGRNRISLGHGMPPWLGLEPVGSYSFPSVRFRILRVT